MSGDGSAHDGRDAEDPEREDWFRRWVVTPSLGVVLVLFMVALLLSPFVVGWVLISRGIQGTWLWDAPSLCGIAGILCLLFLRLDRRRPHRPWLGRATAVCGWVCANLAVPAVFHVLVKPAGKGTLVFLILLGTVTGLFTSRRKRKP